MQFGHMEQNLGSVLQRLSEDNRRLEEKYRSKVQAVEQKFYHDNPHMHNRYYPALQRLNDANCRAEGGYNLKFGKIAKRLGQIDLGASPKGALLRSSAAPFDVEAYRPKGGSKAPWMRSLIKNLIRMFEGFQEKHTGRKLFKSEFEQFLFDRFPISKRAIEEIWKQVRGEWQCGGRPEAKLLAERISQKDLEAHFADFREKFIRELRN